MTWYHFIFLLTIIGTLASACQASTKQAYNYSLPIYVNETKLLVELADTPEKQQQGLSGRPALTNKQGMLFDFRGIEHARPSFWMKDMNFALDLIWIKDNRIIGVTPNVPTPKNAGAPLPTYSPPGEIDLVLEVLAGWSDQHQIEVGDEIKF